MKRFLFALSVWLAMPLSAAAAVTGDSCTIDAPTAAAGLATDTAPKVVCRFVAVTTSAGAAQTFGPVFVPGGGVGYAMAVFRVLRGNSAAGCGYDDLQVFELSARTLAASTEKALIGVLDDDGTSTPTGGVQQIKVFGPVGPYIYLTGTATAGTCNASNPLEVELILYPNINFP